jgi:hypothetical protein
MEVGAKKWRRKKENDREERRVTMIEPLHFFVVVVACNNKYGRAGAGWQQQR